MMRAVVLFAGACTACGYPALERLMAPPLDAMIDDASQVCRPDERRCVAEAVSTCVDNEWRVMENCAAVCSNSSCVNPPSCEATAGGCAVGATDNCCHSLALLGGDFTRSYDGVEFRDKQFSASISSFSLDKYEVTVRRFNAFVNAYPASKPQEGAGKNPHDVADIGWLLEWNDYLPANAVALMDGLNCSGIGPQAFELPVRCVSWYLAQAFCIWDGGRLPSEAEWNYAAAGGSEQRVFPWSSPPTNIAISSANAAFETVGPSVPGIRPAGDARWGHADMAGNLSEWVLDFYSDSYTLPCHDCSNRTYNASRGLRGGSFMYGVGQLYASVRSGQPPATAGPDLGFRCARDPVP